MADAGTAAPGPSHGAAAITTTFELEVRTLAGGCLAVIPDAQGSWQLGDVLGRLPEVLPGHRYQLLKGDAVLAPGTAIATCVRPVDSKACVTAVVVAAPTEEEQRQLDLALIDAAGELNVKKVRELLIMGADASPRSGLPMIMSALHAVVEMREPRRPGDGRDGDGDQEEEDGRLQTVMGVLLSARADVDARRDHAGLGVTTCTCALHSAVQHGSLGAVRVLLDARANINLLARELDSNPPADCDFTALHVATQAGNLPLVALLLERRANVNAVRRCLKWEHLWPMNMSETALHLAVAGGHQALVALLVQAGADTSIPRSRDSEETSVEELCAGNPGMRDALRADSSATLLAGGTYEAEAEVALAAVAARRAAV